LKNLVRKNLVRAHADIDTFCHPDAGYALARAAANYPGEFPSDDDSA
jgi:hypothetical protein